MVFCEIVWKRRKPEKGTDMLAIERKNEILNRLRNEKRVLVSELAEVYNVTEETIRRDLDKLEKEGYATKTYGGAILGNTTKTDLSYAVRNKANVEAKKMIAALIVDLIEDGDHLMIDHSSTCYFSMKKLREKKNLTVITNSVELASEICTIEGWNVYMTGGQLRPESMALSGPASFEILHTYHVDKTLFSCKGIDMAAGITDSNDLHAEIKHAMVCAAKQPILAVDSSKFDKISFVNIARLQEVRVVVTNTKPSEEWLRTLARMEIRCIYPERT